MKIYARNLSEPISLPFSVTEAPGVAVIEKECIYILVGDPDNFQPKLTFFSLKDLPSQDANGIMSVIVEAFNDVQMPFSKDKLVYLASDGATVNSGTKAGLERRVLHG